MTNAAGLVRVGCVVIAVGALAAGATHATGTVQLAAPHERAGLPVSANVLVDEATLVCPGPQRLGAEGMRDVTGTVTAAVAAPPTDALRTVMTTTGATGTTSAAGGIGSTGATGAGATSTATARVALDGGAVSQPLVAGIRSARSTTAAVTAPTAVFAHGHGSLAPALIASQTWQLLDGDDRGLALTPCSLPSPDLWLVGGGSGPSRTERLLLANPGANAVTVRFEVFGARGPVAPAQGRVLSIPPRSRTVVALDALAPDEPGPAVHVIATGGVVSAVLHDAWIDGATGRGLDDATPSAPPSTDLVVAGLDIAGVDGLDGLDVASTASVRVANPGPREALVQVRVLTPAGPTQPAALRAVRVPAGSTRDVPLTVAPGAAGLHLRSDEPVVAGAWVERRLASGADRMGDFGWAPATPPIRGVAGIPLPGLDRSGTKRSLLLASGAGGASVVVHRARAGEVRSVPTTVGVDSAMTLDLGDADQVWVGVGRGEVRASVTVAGSAAGVPFFSVAALGSAPVTTVSIPVRQVDD